MKNFFGTDDDDDDKEVGGDVNNVNRLLVQKSSASERDAMKLYNDVLAEDPNAFDYDEAYDKFKESENKNMKQKISDAPRAQYIENLRVTAKVRDQEKERRFERKLMKESEAEEKEFGDKPKFVTAAYKQKMLETQKWDYEDKLVEELEMRTDVRSRGMEGFYGNLLTKNVALGGDVEKSAVSAYTAGSNRQLQITITQPPSPNAATDDSSKTQSKRKLDEAISDSNYSEEPAAERSDSSIDPIRETKVTNLITTSTAVEQDKSEIISAARKRFLERKSASMLNN